jgi:hypothetical protein
MISEHPADIILLDYAEGALPGDESDSIRRHVAACRACRRTLREIASAVDELDRLPTAEPGQLLSPPTAQGDRHRLRGILSLLPILLAVGAVILAFDMGRNETSAARRPASARAAAGTRVTLNGRVTVRTVRTLLARARPLAARRGRQIVVLVPASRYRQALALLRRRAAALATHRSGPRTPVVLVSARDQLLAAGRRAGGG